MVNPDLIRVIRGFYSREPNLINEIRRTGNKQTLARYMSLEWLTHYRLDSLPELGADTNKLEYPDIVR